MPPAPLCSASASGVPPKGATPKMGRLYMERKIDWRDDLGEPPLHGARYRQHPVKHVRERDESACAVAINAHVASCRKHELSVFTAFIPSSPHGKVLTQFAR